MRIYADHAATTQLDLDAFEEMKKFLLTEYGNASQPYSFSRSVKAALKSARVMIAKCINAEPEEIFFTSGGTESDNWAIKSTLLEGDKECEIMTSQIEHHAILHACHAIEHMGYNVEYLPVDEWGVVRPSYVNEYINNKVKLVSVMYANNEIGTIQQIKELCSIAHSKGALFHTDAVQAVGHVPIDVKQLGVDMLSASAHKFNGPKGIGFLYIKKETPISPYLDGGAQEFGMRAGTENIAYIVAMAIALEKNCHNMKRNSDHLKKLEDILIGELHGYKLDFRCNGSNYKIPGNISLSFRNAEGEMLLHRLDLMGICVSTGSACDSKNTQISHVLEAIRVPREYAVGTIRVSLGAENTEEEVRYIAKAICKILKS